MRKIRTQLKEEKGFTLIEMLIVILIISVLLILVVTNLDGVNDRIMKTKNEGIIQTVESQMVIYEMETGTKPTVGELQKDSYITEDQMNAYEKAIKDKSSQP